MRNWKRRMRYVSGWRFAAGVRVGGAIFGAEAGFVAGGVVGQAKWSGVAGAGIDAS